MYGTLNDTDDKIRPVTLDDFTGQSNLKEQLKIYIEAAKRRGDVLEHILFSGPPGLGKTTLANIIANEMRGHIVTTSGVVLKNAKDIVDILLLIRKGDILFIDEIHRLNISLEEILYPAIEDFILDVVIEMQGMKEARRIPLNKFTLVGATTKNGLISAPLRDRFGIQAKLELYSASELSDIIMRSASILNITISPDGASEIAKRSHGTARIANSLLRRARDYSVIRSNGVINRNVADSALTMLGIDSMGLDKTDRAILTLLAKSKKPMGIKVISSYVGEDVETVESVYEPFLLQDGFIIATRTGRQITEKGLKHLMSWNRKEDDKKGYNGNGSSSEPNQNYYEVLGIAYDATTEQIKEIYRKLSMIYHPDKGKDYGVNGDERFRSIKDAYETLVDSGKRREYDKKIGVNI